MVFSKQARVILIAFNLIFWIFGAILLALGIWLKFDQDSMAVWESLPIENVVGAGTITSFSLIVIAAGAFTFFVGLIGCWGAISKNKFLLTVYTIVIGLILMINLVALIFVATLYKGITVELSQNATNSVLIHQFLVNDTMQRDELQSAMQCCGIRNPNDYNELNMTIPASCYPSGSNSSSSNSSQPFGNGCGPLLIQNLPIFNYVLGVMIIVEFAAIMFAICLCSKAQKEYENF